MSVKHIDPTRKEAIEKTAVKLAESPEKNKYIEFNLFCNDLYGSQDLRIIDPDGIEWSNVLTITHPEVVYAKNIFFKRIKEIKLRDRDPRGHYVQIFREFHKNLEGKVTNAERSYLLKLMLCIHYDNLLTWEGKVMEKKDIAEYLGISLAFTKDLLQKYIKLEVVEKEKQGRKWFYKFNRKAAVMGSVNEKKRFC